MNKFNIIFKSKIVDLADALEELVKCGYEKFDVSDGEVEHKIDFNEDYLAVEYLDSSLGEKLCRVIHQSGSYKADIVFIEKYDEEVDEFCTTCNVMVEGDKDFILESVVAPLTTIGYDIHDFAAAELDIIQNAQDELYERQLGTQWYEHLGDTLAKKFINKEKEVLFLFIREIVNSGLPLWWIIEELEHQDARKFSPAFNQAVAHIRRVFGMKEINRLYDSLLKAFNAMR